MNINEVQNVGKLRELQNTQRISSESSQVTGNSIFFAENQNRPYSSDELALLKKEENDRYIKYTATGNKDDRETLPGGTAVKFTGEGKVTATYDKGGVEIRYINNKPVTMLLGKDTRCPVELTAENAKVYIPGKMIGGAGKGGQLTYEHKISSEDIGSLMRIGQSTRYHVQNNAYCNLSNGVNLKAGKNSEAYSSGFTSGSFWQSSVGTKGDNAKAETPKVIVSGDAEFNGEDLVLFTGSKDGHIYTKGNGNLYEGNNASTCIDPTKSGDYGSGRVFVSKPVKVQEDRGTEKQ